MKTSNRLKNSQIATILALIMLLSACTKDDEATDKPAPQLPPQSSFVIDFENFKDADTSNYKSSLTYQNWGWAATNVAVWNAALTITLAVPVAAFYESFNHTGVYDPGSNSWVWSYNFFAGGAIHLAQLKASLVPDGVKWEMYISKNNAYNEFLWYTGISATDNAGGTWQLNISPQEPSPFISIIWSRDVVNEFTEIKYINVIPGHDDNGSYIYYGIDNNLELNAFYDIFSESHNNLMNIRWSRELKLGQVKDGFHFGNNNWHCWDENLEDVVCE